MFPIAGTPPPHKKEKKKEKKKKSTAIPSWNLFPRKSVQGSVFVGAPCCFLDISYRDTEMLVLDFGAEIPCH